MKRVLYLLCYLLFSGNLVYSQSIKRCESSENLVEDISNIKKCVAIKKTSETSPTNPRQITLKVATPKKRFFMVRKKEEASTLGADLNTSGVSNTSTDSSELEKSLVIKKTVAAIASREVRKTLYKFKELKEIPLFKSCEDVNINNRKKCFNKNMNYHLTENFHYPEEAEEKGIEGIVHVKFIIDEKGKVSDIKTVGPDDGKALEFEAEKIIWNLPKLIPGSKDGKPISTEYSFSINFSLQ